MTAAPGPAAGAAIGCHEEEGGAGEVVVDVIPCFAVTPAPWNGRPHPSSLAHEWLLPRRGFQPCLLPVLRGDRCQIGFHIKRRTTRRAGPSSRPRRQVARATARSLRAATAAWLVRT